MSLKMALMMMGYRELGEKTNKWAKPIGYMLFVITVKENGSWEFESWFKSAQGQLMVFERENASVDPSEAVSWLKEIETYSRHDVYTHHNNPNNKTRFEFLTKDQEMSLMDLGI